MHEIEDVQVILKTTERCNLACTYCYFFTDERQEYLNRPAVISRKTLESVSTFLSDGAKDLGLKRVAIGFHGGEPTLQKKSDFDFMCELFRRSLEDVVELDLVIQTNAARLDNEWIRLFERHHVRVGVSIDGPQSANDRARLDHKGRSSFDKVVAGVRALREARERGALRGLGALCVGDPRNDQRELLDFMVGDLGIKSLDVLLPQAELAAEPEAYGQMLCDLFDAWIDQNDSRVRIRIIDDLLAKLGGRSSYIFPSGGEPSPSVAFRISSDGALLADEVVRFDHWPQANVAESRMSRWLGHEAFGEVRSPTVPDGCRNCEWVRLCGGGHPWHRMSPAATDFNRPSSLCAGLKRFYSHVCDYLGSRGLLSSSALMAG